MIVFGVDPGTIRTGFGVIRAEGNRVEPLGYGVIRALSAGKGDYGARLLSIARGLEEELGRYPVDVVALEEAFFGKSVSSAVRIGEARGVVLVTAARLGLQVAQYPPATVKKTVVGDGGAVKERVQEMVKVHLGLEDKPKPDAADALAIALCHAFRGPQADLFGRTRGRRDRRRGPGGREAPPFSSFP